jgi:DNA-binding Lrp family transcriptional regulator
LVKIDETDKSILNRIQSDFPITSKPYHTIADELGLDAEDVLARIKQLKKDGIIRRIGGNFVPGKLGFVSTLCAARVPADKIESFAAVVNRYPGVTHNYRRENDFNIWFTFIAPSREEIETNLQKISEETGIKDILNLPATHVFKIKAKFEV